MSTGVIIVLIVVAAIIIGAAVWLTTSRGAGGGGRNLRRRFGPEYDRAVAQHDGDATAAERDLADRVKRHGSLRRQPLEPAARERYEARWAAAGVAAARQRLPRTGELIELPTGFRLAGSACRPRTRS
jgi:hypothetical protein